MVAFTDGRNRPREGTGELQRLQEQRASDICIYNRYFRPSLESFHFSISLLEQSFLEL